jgi:transposase
MRGQLSPIARLTQLVTRLKNNIKIWKEKVNALKKELKAKDRLIKELQEKLTDKEQQRKQLLSYLYKPGKKNDQDKQNRKPRSASFHRKKPDDSQVTQTLEFPICQCPRCQAKLGNIADTSIQYEEDIDISPRVIIKKFLIHRYWCSHCHEFVRSNQIPPITRIGANTMGYILYARYRLRLPIDKIKESLNDLHNFTISEGEIIEKLKEAKELFSKDYEAICELIKLAKFVHADETGWRINGQNWWLWVFVTDKGLRYIIEDTRGKGVAQDALGTKQDRVIISDGYAAYGKLPGDKQQCWVHLLRNAKAASLSLYQDLLKIYITLTDELAKPLNERRQIQFFEDELRIIIAKKYNEPEATKIQQRAQRHSPYLFTCLRYEGVLPENNTAERAIRPQAVMRKIFGGSRSLDGAKAHEVNTSVIETQLRQNPNQSFFNILMPLINQRRSEL